MSWLRSGRTSPAEAGPQAGPAISVRSHRRQIAAGAGWNLFATAVAFCLAPPVTILLVRRLSHVNFGSLAIGSAVAQFLALFAGLGLAPAVAQRLGVKRGEDLDVIAATIKRALHLAAISSILIVPVVGLIAFALSLAPSLREAALVLCVLIPTVALAPLYESLLGMIRGTFAARRASIANVVASTLSALSIIAILEAGVTSPLAVAGARSAAWLTALLVMSGVLRGWGSRIRKAATDVDDDGKLVRVSLAMLLHNVAGVAISQLDVFLVGVERGTGLAGLYAPASRLADTTLGLGSVTGNYLLPALSSHAARGDYGAVRNTYHWASRWSVVLSSPFLAALIATPHDTLVTLFGSSKHIPVLPTRVLGIAALVHITFGFNGIALDAFGRAGATATRALLGLVTSAIACLILIPTFGLSGAAIATLLAIVVINLFCSMVLRSEFGILPWDRPFAAATLVLVGSIIGSAAVIPSLDLGPAPTAVLAAAVVGAATTCAAVFAGSSDDRRALGQLLRRPFRPHAHEPQP